MQNKSTQMARVKKVVLLYVNGEELLTRNCTRAGGYELKLRKTRCREDVKNFNSHTRIVDALKLCGC